MDIKKVWIAPELVIYGNVENITKTVSSCGSCLCKKFGGGDGAVYSNQNVTWGC